MRKADQDRIDREKKKVQAILGKSIKSMAPPPTLSLSEWANRYRYLSGESSSEPGRFSTDRVPFQKGMLDAVTDPANWKIILMCSAQVGKTTTIENILGYYMHLVPCPILSINPTLEMAETFSKDRIEPMIRDCPVLNEKFHKKKKTSGNTIRQKKFSGGHLTFAGANSPASLASRPVRIALFDETDRFEASAGKEGDPIKLGEKRTTAFPFNKKVILVSTPLIKGSSPIEAGYLASDQRKYFVPCPHCEQKIVLKWSMVKWDKGDPKSARIYCSECGEAIEEKCKKDMNRKGEWIATAPFNGVAGFHISELYSPWVRLYKMVEEFLEATKRGPNYLRVWVNTALGETWEQKEGTIPSFEELFKRRGPYKKGIIPTHGLILTGAIDIQKDRFEIEIVAWGRDRVSWSIDYIVIPADTSQENEWSKLDFLLEDEFEREDGRFMKIAKLSLDTGFQTQNCYKWAKRKYTNRILLIKGSSNSASAIFASSKQIEISSKGKKLKTGLRLWMLGVSLLKEELYGWLNLELPEDEIIDESSYPPGWCHFPIDYPEHYFKMLTAEHLSSKTVGGKKVYFWEKHFERNEALDLKVYNRAAAYNLGIDRFKEKAWRTIEKSYGIFKNEPKGHE